MTPIIQELQSEAQANQAANQAASQAQQSWLQQAMQAMQDAFTTQGQQMQSQAQAAQSSLAAILAQDQSSLASQTQRAQSIGVATGGIGPVATPTASNVSAWATSLGIPLSWAQQYLSQGGTMGAGLGPLQAFLDSKGYRNQDGSLNLVPAAVRAAGSQTGAYVAGGHPASAASPAGGGTWNGQSDAQIQQLFRNTYGPNWQTQWNQQHAAAVAKNGG